MPHYSRVKHTVDFFHLRSALQFMEQFPEEELPLLNLRRVKQDIQENFLASLVSFRNGLGERKHLLDKLIKKINTLIVDGNPIMDLGVKELRMIETIDSIHDITQRQALWYVQLLTMETCLNPSNPDNGYHPDHVKQRYQDLDNKLNELRIQAESLGDFSDDRKARKAAWTPYSLFIKDKRAYEAELREAARLALQPAMQAWFSSMEKESPETAEYVEVSLVAEHTEPSEMAEGEEDAPELDVDEMMDAVDGACVINMGDETESDDTVEVKRMRL